MGWSILDVMRHSILESSRVGVPILLLALCLSLSVVLVLPAIAKVTPIMYNDEGDPDELQGCQAGETPAGTWLVNDGYVEPLRPETESITHARLAELSRCESSVRPVFVPPQSKWLLAINVILSSLRFRF